MEGSYCGCQEDGHVQQNEGQKVQVHHRHVFAAQTIVAHKPRLTTSTEETLYADGRVAEVRAGAGVLGIHGRGRGEGEEVGGGGGGEGVRGGGGGEGVARQKSYSGKSQWVVFPTKVKKRVRNSTYLSPEAIPSYAPDQDLAHSHYKPLNKE